MPKDEASLKIGLLDNASHSLKRGYEQWHHGREAKDPMMLKEAVIWVHHGIELTLKQLLVQASEYLVFENIDEAISKLDKLRKRSAALEQATVLDLFEHGQGAFTVGFSKLLERVAVMLDVTELRQGAPLRRSIDDLALYRNKIVHFSVTINVAEVAVLLFDILDPLLSVLDREIADARFKSTCIPDLRRLAKSVTDFSQDLVVESEEQIKRILYQMRGRVVDGELLGTTDPVLFPEFVEISRGGTAEIVSDLEARSSTEDWVVEIKLRIPFLNLGIVLEQLEALGGFYRERTGREPKVWLVVLGGLPATVKSELGKSGIFVSTRDDLIQLEAM